MEILEASIERVHRSVFDDNGKADKEFTRFKSTLNKIITQENFNSQDFVAHIISYTNNKYNKQIAKI